MAHDIDHSDLWSDVGVDWESEHIADLVTVARQQGTSTWAYLAAAEGHQEFEHRRAMASDSLDRCSSKVTRDEPERYLAVRTALDESYIRDFQVHHEARLVAEQAQNAPRAAQRAQERQAAGSTKECPKCKGRGFTKDQADDRWAHDKGEPKCPGCGGKGWVKTCIYDGLNDPATGGKVDHHSDDIMEVYSGSPEPVYICGYHEQRFGVPGSSKSILPSPREQRSASAATVAAFSNRKAPRRHTASEQNYETHQADLIIWNTFEIYEALAKVNTVEELKALVEPYLKRPDTGVRGDLSQIDWDDLLQGVLDDEHMGIGGAGRTAAYNPFNDQNNPYVNPHKPSADELERKRLFPDGIPLHGDLTPEQQAWMNKGRKKSAGNWGDGLIGKQMLGFPGSRITGVEPTSDYLINGPVGDGWYEPSEDRYVTTDFIVHITLEDGREVTIPKSYAWVAKQKGSDAKVTVSTKTAGVSDYDYSDTKYSNACGLGEDNYHCDGTIPEDEKFAGQPCDCPCHESWGGEQSLREFHQGLELQVEASKTAIGDQPSTGICDKCGREVKPWPLERGNRCSPKDWVYCIRNDGKYASRHTAADLNVSTCVYCHHPIHQPANGGEWTHTHNADGDHRPMPKFAMRKGAPFAGYEDFEDCTAQNADKDDPSAYCGEIKHRTEDKKASLDQRFTALMNKRATTGDPIDWKPGDPVACHHCGKPVTPSDPGYDPGWGTIQIHQACVPLAEQDREDVALKSHQKWWDSMDPEFRKGYEDMGLTRDNRHVSAKTAAGAPPFVKKKTPDPNDPKAAADPDAPVDPAEDQDPNADPAADEFVDDAVGTPASEIAVGDVVLESGQGETTVRTYEITDVTPEEGTILLHVKSDTDEFDARVPVDQTFQVHPKGGKSDEAPATDTKAPATDDPAKKENPFAKKSRVEVVYTAPDGVRTGTRVLLDQGDHLGEALIRSADAVQRKVMLDAHTAAAIPTLVHFTVPGNGDVWEYLQATFGTISAQSVEPAGQGGYRAVLNLPPEVALTAQEALTNNVSNWSPAPMQLQLAAAREAFERQMLNERHANDYMTNNPYMTTPAPKPGGGTNTPTQPTPKPASDPNQGVPTMDDPSDPNATPVDMSQPATNRPMAVLRSDAVEAATQPTKERGYDLHVVQSAPVIVQVPR